MKIQTRAERLGLQVSGGTKVGQAAFGDGLKIEPICGRQR